MRTLIRDNAHKELGTLERRLHVVPFVHTWGPCWGSSVLVRDPYLEFALHIFQWQSGPCYPSSLLAACSRDPFLGIRTADT